MMRFFFGFLVLTAIAALFGFGGMGDYSWDGARRFFYLFLGDGKIAAATTKITRQYSGPHEPAEGV